ncbi:Na+/H+ antiporter NhaC family protein [Elusimicrobiota bacterium]
MKKRLLIFIGIFGGLAFLSSILWGPKAVLNAWPIYPPLIAIALAFITHEVIFSLFVGIFAGAVLSYPLDTYNNFLCALWKGLFKSLDTYIHKSLADTDHMAVIIFTLLIGGTVGLINKSGGIEAIVNFVSKKVKNPMVAQLSTWFLGIVIFFDDYANCLIVGNTMRSISDKYRISREKLSFIIDATAAPVSSVFLVSTWIGYEIGLISESFKANNIGIDPYMAFIYSIPHRFYVIILLLAMPIFILMRRDFGPMLKAEQRAKKTGHTLRPGSKPIVSEEMDKVKAGKKIPKRAINAILPICVLVFGVILGLWYTGYQSIAEKSGVDAANTALFRDILSNASSFKALLWASFASSICAMLLILGQGIMSFSDTLSSWADGMKSMFVACIILTLAWSIGSITKDIGTANFVCGVIEGSLSHHYLPVIVFLVAAVTSFATGTSWGTMAILFPIVIPLALNLGGDAGLTGEPMNNYIYACIGTVLSGAVFGDHCSPISDTTIISSMACAMDHMDHVNTQLPYCLFVGIVAMVVGYLPVGFGFAPYILNLIGIVLLAIFIYFLGTKVEKASA